MLLLKNEGLPYCVEEKYGTRGKMEKNHAVLVYDK